MAGAQPLVVFWYEWGIHVLVVLSFVVQATLLLLADIRRCKDWTLLTVIIWSAYTAADTTAVYALGHMSVLVRWPEHHLMALWAALLLVHLGGQDNITAYAIEDNQLWLRHLQTLAVQVGAAAYVLYVSSIFSLPSLLRWATIIMYVVGVLKYGERVWSLWSANGYASSSLSATSYKDFRGEQNEQQDSSASASNNPPRDKVAIIAMAHRLLHIPKQMFKGPTRYVINKNSGRTYSAEYMSSVVELQMSMMYDLLYTKAAVVHTRVGVCIRVISLPSTVAALLMFHAAMRRRGEVAVYRGADITITYVLLTGAVVVEALSVLRAVFSVWTVALLSERKWHKLARKIAIVQRFVFRILVRSEGLWSGAMRQQSIFVVFLFTSYNIGSKIARWMEREDWWDSMFHSRSTRVTKPIIDKVLEMVSSAEDGEVGDISRAQGLNAVKSSDETDLETLIKGWKLDLADSILVWHIATEVYTDWYNEQRPRTELFSISHCKSESTELSKYMLYVLAARPYMLPYPVTRQSYVQLCHDSVTRLRLVICSSGLKKDILKQKEALMGGTPFDPYPYAKRRIIGVSSINITLDKACQLAATLIHRAGEGNAGGIMDMIFKVWVDMLCYAAYGCDEKSHAKNLTNGGDIMTIVSLLMVYMSNGFIQKTNKASSSAPNETTGGASTSSGGATDDIAG